MQLSERLQTVVNMITKGGKVADIGCDHAYLSIYMIKHQIAESVIAMDVNRGPLERARDNIRKSGYENQINVRLSDGIKELNVGEADTLLIAGMGGGLIQKILSGNPEVLEQIQELVLQPQSEIMEVRRFVEGIGFTLVDENMVIDEGKYYVVLKAKRVVPQETYNNEVYYRYGKFLLEKKHLCMFSFLKQEEKKNLAIIESLEKHPSDRNEKTKEKIRKDNTYCREGLGYYDM
ncbi:MAG: SAM-dependent methyltransferase [Lachnospiraceae bacterium]|nr:SAM-dependent methyltransferase [Lachnospiraceae bacterium]